MSRRNLHALIGLLVALSLLVSCAPPEQRAAPQPTEAPATAGASPAAPAATPKPAATVASTPGAAAGETPVRGGTFIVSLRDDPPSFDVHQEASFSTCSPIGSPAYNALLTWDNVDHKKIVPDLAKRWELSQDGLTYTFYLEEGAKWHDGTPFSAEDVKFSLMREKNPPRGVNIVNRAMFEPMQSVEVINPYTVKIQTSRPVSSFPTMMTLTNNVIMPKHILEKQPDMKREVIGTGPWKLKKYTRGVGIELERNPEYFKKGLPYMDRYLQYIIADGSARLASFRTGRVLTDIKDHEPPGIDTIEKTMADLAIAHRLPGMPSTRNPFMTQTRPPFNDVRVRQAVNLALDRWEFVRICEPGMYSVGGYTVPGGLWALPDEELNAQPGYAKTGPAKDAERDQAKRLLAEAGYPNGFEFEMELRVGGQFDCEAVWLNAQLEKIGLKSTIKRIETAAYYDHLQNQGFQMMPSGYAFTVDDPDLMFAEAYSKDGGKNWGKYYNPEFDRLNAEQSITVDPAKRKEITRRLQLMLHETVPFPILGWVKRTVGVWKKVKGYVPWTTEGRLSPVHRHEYTWLDPNLPPK